MISVTLRDVLKLTGGRLVGNCDLGKTIEAICTDTREVRGNEMFVAYKGKNADGNMFVTEALDKGCIGCLVESVPDKCADGKFCVVVDNTVDALWEIVAFRRKQIRAKIICVTGSVGKTTTTGMIASVLRQKYTVFETEDNRNDEFLCPEMIFRITDECEYAVLEIGMGMISSVSRMAKIIEPDYIVLTKIGYAHIEKTGSLTATLDEKCGTENGLRPGGIVFVNGDDDLQMSYPFRKRTAVYGRGYNDSAVSDMPSYLEYAARAAVAVGIECDVSLDDIATGLREYRPSDGRMDVVKKKEFTLVDSSFNASIESIKLAVDYACSIKGRHIAVIGEMLELGVFSDSLHKTVGAYVGSKVDVLISVGKYAKSMAETAKKYGAKALAADGIENAYDILMSCLLGVSENNVILVKGSHGSEVWKIADKLKEM